jgi:hypothetical protein
MSEFQESEESVDELFVPTDEAIPVTAEEAASLGVAQDENKEPEEPHIAQLVCDVCLELNLTTKAVVEKCVRCGQAFCFHFQSAIDSQYCVNCMSDVSVTKSVITKTYTHTNQETGEQSFYRRRAREIKIDGLSWLFAQRKIVELSDVELDMAIEYHRNIYSLMMDEAERRRNEKMHRYANTPFKIPTPTTTKVTDNTQTTVKKSRTTSKTKAGETVAALLQSMLAKGMTIEQIIAAATKK